MGDLLTWCGIVFCISQSAIFSGLNLAFFSLTRLRLESEVEAAERKGAVKILQMRNDSNFLLTTILWGNVGINVLLTLLSDSVMTGLVSFTFSTVIITFFGEIIPQAYFSRNAMQMASLLAPVLRVYQFILFPVAKPCAILLDKWLGKDMKEYLSEEVIKLVIKKHVEEAGTEIDKIEGRGAINFLTLDDIKVCDEGEFINAASIIHLKTENGKVVFPEHTPSVTDTFIQKINSSCEKWIVFVDESGEPQLVLDADGFIRSIYSEDPIENIEAYSHKPLVVTDDSVNLGQLIARLKHKDKNHSDRPIERDIALFWSEKQKRIITGSDLFGRLLAGI